MVTQTEKALDDIRKLLKSKKLIVGTERTMKGLKTGKVAQVFYAANCPKDVKSDLEHYCKLGDVEQVALDIDNVEFGVVCKKPFSISVISIVRD